MDALRDQNHVTTILAYNETTGLTEPVRVDPVTGAILVFGVSASTGTPSDLVVSPRDQNHCPAKLAYNETSGEMEAVRCTTNNTLLVKMV